MDSPADSYLAVPAVNDSVSPSSVAYKQRLIDGTSVISEVPVKPRASQGSNIRGEESPRPGPDQPQAGHHDGISDIAMCQASQCFLLSGSRDGVIKVWK